MKERLLERDLADERATVLLGQDLAAAVRPGDVVCLEGDLGAGKTTLARALIRALADQPSLDVPSPTFTLVQIYATPVPVHHLDLYRLTAPDEFCELGLDEALRDGAVALIEWPERTDQLPAERIRVVLSHAGDGRRAAITGPAPALARIGRAFAARAFLAAAGVGDADRSHLSGDASARSYERIRAGKVAPRILMNAPPLVLGPPVKDGRAYAEIAHSALSVDAFVAIAGMLRAHGVVVPAIDAQDLGQGFLLIEDVGDDGIVAADGTPIAVRYEAAAKLLATLHRQVWPNEARAGAVVHAIPPFDRGAMMIEAELLLDWYLPAVMQRPASEAERAAFATAWNAAFDRLSGKEYGFMHRDFQSTNIVWQKRRSGGDRLAILDFQDGLIGPTAYDVASIALDARVSISEELERRIVDAYVAARRAAGAFDEQGFAEAYAIMAAQRNTKILGIFVRLHRRDGKPHYLQHLPRIRDYLRRVFRHPALADLAALYNEAGFLAERPL